MTNTVTIEQGAPKGRVVAIYVRVSTDQQETERQRKSLRETAEAMFPDNPVCEFTDEGISAFKFSIDQRPGGSQLCTRIETGTVAAVLADAQDRISRGGDEEWIAFRALCRAYDTRIVIDGREMSDEMGSKLEGYLKALLANQESVEKSHRVRSGLRSLRSDGYWPFGPAPFGYDATGEKRRRILTPNADSEHIPAAFELFDSGESIGRVAAYLGEATGRTFNRHTARYILANPVYLGLIPEGVYKPGRGRKIGGTHPGLHPALVAEDLFHRVRERLDGYSAARERQSDVHPFGPVARCGCCGHALRYKPVNRPKREPDVYLQCENRACNKIRVPLENVESGVLFSLAAVRVCLHERLEDTTWAVAHPDTAQLDQLAVELEQVRSQIETVLVRESEGVLSPEMAERRLAALTERERHTEKVLRSVGEDGRNLRANLAELREQLDSLAPEYGTCTEEEAGLLLFWLSASVAERRRYLASLLESVEILPADDNRETPAGFPYSLKDALIVLTFRAGIDFKIPVALKRDRRLSPVLRDVVGLGGRKVIAAR